MLLFSFAIFLFSDGGLETELLAVKHESRILRQTSYYIICDLCVWLCDLCVWYIIMLLPAKNMVW